MKDLQDMLDKLEIREKDVSAQHSGNVEKENILRQIRFGRRSISSDIKEIQFTKSRKEHKKSETSSKSSKTATKKTKIKTDVKTDTLECEVGDKDKLKRLETILSNERSIIEKRKETLEYLMESGDEYLTEEEEIG